MSSSSSSSSIARKIAFNFQRARDKQELIKKYGRQGKLIKFVQNRSKTNTQIDETLSSHVEKYKFNGPAQILSSSSTQSIYEELREKLSNLNLNKAYRRTATIRAHHLTNYLSNYIINAFQSGYIGRELNDKHPTFQISRILLDADLRKLEICWLTTTDETANEDIEKNYLNRLSSQIRHEIISNQIIGYMPPVVFTRDNSKMILEQLDDLLKIKEINKKTENSETATKSENQTKTANNVYGIDHDKLMSQIKPEITEVVEADPAKSEEEARKKFDLTLKAMRINEKIKKEKISKSALLQLAIAEFESSKTISNSRKSIVDEDIINHDDYNENNE